MPGVPCQPVVSIQRDGAGTAVDRHLSWGVLVDADAVLVPGPLDWLRESKITFEVLLASARRAGPGVVERIRPRRAEVAGVETAPDLGAGLIWLDRPSRHRPSAASF